MSTRDEFVDVMKAQLDEWNAMIGQLEAKAKKEKAETKIKYEKQIQDMKSKRDAVQEKLNRVPEATDDAWETFKKDSGKLLDQMKNTLTETKDAFLRGLNEKR